jgi:hypothetical protein
VRRFCTALLVCALGLAACGGSEDDGPTETEFRRAANAACAKASVALMKTPLPETERKAERFGRQTERARTARWRALRTVEPPSSLRESYDRTIAGRDLAELKRLGLARCASEGVAGFEGGQAWIDRVEPACTSLLDRMSAETALSNAESTRDWARRFRRVARAMKGGVPDGAEPAVKGAATSLRQTGAHLDAVAAGRAVFDIFDPHESIIRGEAALDLLDAAECRDIYPALMGQ